MSPHCELINKMYCFVIKKNQEEEILRVAFERTNTTKMQR